MLLHFQETRGRINSGYFAAVVSSLPSTTGIPQSSLGPTAFGRISVPWRLWDCIHTLIFIPFLKRSLKSYLSYLGFGGLFFNT